MAECNYSQFDKESLALVVGVKHFHDYLYGKTFEIMTDHKPLLSILAGDCQTPLVLSLQLLWWTVFLAVYSYTLLHRSGKVLGHADALSCCPLPELVDLPTLPGLPAGTT